MTLMLMVIDDGGGHGGRDENRSYCSVSLTLSQSILLGFDLTHNILVETLDQRFLHKSLSSMLSGAKDTVTGCIFNM